MYDLEIWEQCATQSILVRPPGQKYVRKTRFYHWKMKCYTSYWKRPCPAHGAVPNSKEMSTYVLLKEYHLFSTTLNYALQATDTDILEWIVYFFMIGESMLRSYWRCNYKKAISSCDGFFVRRKCTIRKPQYHQYVKISFMSSCVECCQCLKLVLERIKIIIVIDHDFPNWNDLHKFQKPCSSALEMPEAKKHQMLQPCSWCSWELSTTMPFIHASFEHPPDILSANWSLGYVAGQRSYLHNLLNDVDGCHLSKSSIVKVSRFLTSGKSRRTLP